MNPTLTYGDSGVAAREGMTLFMVGFDPVENPHSSAFHEEWHNIAYVEAEFYFEAEDYWREYMGTKRIRNCAAVEAEAEDLRPEKMRGIYVHRAPRSEYD
jgi:hypothetical protein